MLIMTERKKRILILIPRMGGGGAERVVSILANNLCHKYCIRIATLVSRGEFYKLDPAVEVVSAKYDIKQSSVFARRFSLAKNLISSFLFIRKSIKEFKPDIFFPLMKEMDLISFFAIKGLKGVKRINSERNDPSQRTVFYKKALKTVYKNSDMLVCQTQFIADFYSSTKNKVIIPNPVDVKQYPKSVPEGTNKKIVSVGRLTGQKNFLMLEKAFAKIAKQYPDVTVTIYGEGPQRQMLEQAIEQDGLKDRFILYGASKDVLNEIKDASIFAFSTNFEGFPNALIEAIALGIPVVTTDFASGVAREVVNEKAGIVVPVGDVEAFTNGLKDLLDHPEKRNYIRNHSHEVIEPFAIDKVIAKWDNLFQTV